MQLEQLIYLLPCRAIEDLSLERSNDEAEELLSAWCALYHPALIARADAVPHWASAEEPPDEPNNALIIVPPCCEAYLPGDWVGRAETAGARLVRDLRRRDQIVTAAMKAIEVESTVDADLAADFLALGYGQFLIEMLTRQMRYMSNLDEVSFRHAAVAAAKAAVAADIETAKRELQEAFTLLYQSREYFYPVESHLIDLTLVAPTTLGDALRGELNAALPANVLLSAGTLAEMAEREPATLAQLKEAVAKGTVGLLGGELAEPPLPLMPVEAIVAELDRGLAVYQRHLDARPTVFGRRRFGLSPVLPQLLEARGFSGALHSTLDDGRFPTANQSRILWEGIDGSSLESIGKVPIDVGQVQAFLRLPERLGSSMDIDHVATVVFAHWPGQSSPWYDDLRRIAGYTTAAGTFDTVAGYFAQSGISSHRAQHKPDEYRSPYLKQAIDAHQVNPISRWAAYYRLRTHLAAAEAIQAIGAAAGASLPPAADLQQLAERIDRSVDELRPNLDDVEATLSAAFDTAAPAVAAALCPQSSGPRGYLVVNPCSFARRVCVDVSKLERLPAAAPPVVACGEAKRLKQVVVEAPAMGFAWVGAGQGAATASPAPRRGWFQRKTTPEEPVAADNVLQNEFFHVVIDRTGGGIRAVLDDASRGPRMAQQLALRWPEGDEHDAGHESHYTISAADEIRVVSPGPIVGEIVSRGRLMDRDGRRRAGFMQTTRVTRGSRLIEIEVELDLPDAPTGNPWQSYFAARFAWSDETASIRRGVNGVSVATDATTIEAPEFIEVHAAKTRTAILPGGLPYHRRLGYRRLDTILVVPGETQRRFRLGIGVDCPSAAMAAIDFLSPPLVVETAAPPATHGWLFHIEGRSVVATHWSPVMEEGRMTGIRVRLLETEGRSVRFGLRTPRPLASAVRIGPNEQTIDVPVAGDRAEIELRGYGWIELELRFA